jgi:glycosyltransferase involved in cell wall biosynthesis
MTELHQPRIAFVQDALPFWGGAERTLETALEAFPDASLYSLVFNRDAFNGSQIGKAEAHTSFLDRLPGAHSHHRAYFPLMPAAIRSLNLEEADIILSFHYAVAHGVRVRPGQLHLSYTYTPMRYAYQARERFLRGLLPGPPRWAAGFGLERFRRWDRRAAWGVHRFAAISGWVGELIERYYNRPATVIYPPVDVERFAAGGKHDAAYLVVSRLEPHKNVERIVKAFNLLERPLWVVGKGSQESFLRKLAGPTVQILGWQPDEALPGLYARARAIVHACEEDFGISMVEGLAAGCPVIALGSGSALELVRDGENGLLFDGESIADITNAVQNFEDFVRLDEKAIRESALPFARERFQSELKAWVEESWERFQHGRNPEVADGPRD